MPGNFEVLLRPRVHCLNGDLKVGRFRFLVGAPKPHAFDNQRAFGGDIQLVLESQMVWKHHRCDSPIASGERRARGSRFSNAKPIPTNCKTSIVSGPRKHFARRAVMAVRNLELVGARNEVCRVDFDPILQGRRSELQTADIVAIDPQSQCLGRCARIRKGPTTESQSKVAWLGQKKV